MDTLKQSISLYKIMKKGTEQTPDTFDKFFIDNLDHIRRMYDFWNQVKMIDSTDNEELYYQIQPIKQEMNRRNENLSYLKNPKYNNVIPFPKF